MGFVCRGSSNLGMAGHIIIGIQKGTIILTATQMVLFGVYTGILGTRVGGALKV